MSAHDFESNTIARLFSIGEVRGKPIAGRQRLIFFEKSGEETVRAMGRRESPEISVSSEER